MQITQNVVVQDTRAYPLFQTTIKTLKEIPRKTVKFGCFFM